MLGVGGFLGAGLTGSTGTDQGALSTISSGSFAYGEGDVGAGGTMRINTYDEYGVPGATNLGRFGYTGHIWLPEAGMYYARNRMYEPRLGRFMQTDPIGYDDGPNIYAYVRNDPINAVDRFGLETFDCGGAVCDTTPIDVIGDPCRDKQCVGPPNGSGPGAGSLTFPGSRDNNYAPDTIVVTARKPQTPQSKGCSGNGSIFSEIAEGAGTVGDYADGVALTSGALGLATAPTGAGGAFFGGTAIVAGFVGRGASVVQTGAYLLDGNYTAAGSSALGIIGGEAVGRLAGGIAGRFMARNRMFNDLSAGQARRADLFGNAAGAAGSRIASRTVCK